MEEAVRETKMRYEKEITRLKFELQVSKHESDQLKVKI